MKLLLAAGAMALAACWPGIKPEQPRRTPTRDFASQLAHASQTGDVAAIRKLLGPKVTNGGLWFTDLDCTHEFAGPGEIGGGRLDELARCLTTLKLDVSKRGDALPEVAVMTYAPGIEIEARFIDRPDGPWLSWIGYAARRGPDDALPTITPEQLETLRTAGDPRPTVPALNNEHSARSHFAYAWLKVCIDRDGAVSRVDVRDASTVHAGRMLADIAKAWRFRPFTPAGQPIPVCALDRIVTPPANTPPHETIPPSVAPPHGEAIIDVATLHQIGGKQHSLISDAVNAQMRAAGLTRVWVEHMFCVGVDGKVTSVQMLRASELPEFDKEVESAMWTWVYEPQKDDGTAVPVCTGEVFQHEFWVTGAPR